MCLAILLVEPFTDNPLAMHQNRAYHWVGRNIATALLCKLNAAMHIFFVDRQVMDADLLMPAKVIYLSLLHDNPRSAATIAF